MTDSSFLATGWSFPPTFDNANYKLIMNSEISNINQSIDLILLTHQGSRSLQPDFGSNLHHYIFQTMNATLEEKIIQSVKSSLMLNEPRILIDSVEISPSNDKAKFKLLILYTVRQTNSRHNHVYPFSLREGTLLQQSE